MSIKTTYRASELECKNTLIWGVVVMFWWDSEDGLGVWVNIGSTGSYFHCNPNCYESAQTASDFAKDAPEPFHQSWAEVRSENHKRSNFLCYDPAERKFWTKQHPVNDTLFEDLFEMAHWFEQGTKKHKDKPDKGLSKYLQLLAKWEAIQDLPNFTIKRRDIRGKLSRSDFRSTMLNQPWNDKQLGYRERWRHDENGKLKALLDSIYGNPDLDLTRIKKSANRKQRKIAKVRQLSKREQQFFALMAGAKSITNISKIKV